MNEVKFNMPPGIVSAIERGAAAAKAYGYPNMQLSIVDGKISRMSLFDRDGRQRYVERGDKDWHEYVNVDG